MTRERVGEESYFDNFRNEVVLGGAPETFGTDEPIYQFMLEKSGVGRRLKRRLRTTRTAIVGCTPESAIEFVVFMRNLNPRTKTVIVDFSPVATRLAIIKLTTFFWCPKPKRVGVIQSDAKSLDIKGGLFDAVFTNLLLNNMDLKEDGNVRFEGNRNGTIDFLKEAYRVLKPGGGIFLSESTGFWSKELEKGLTNANLALESVGFKSVYSGILRGSTREEYLTKHSRANEIRSSQGYGDRIFPENSWWGLKQGFERLASYGIK